MFIKVFIYSFGYSILQATCDEARDLAGKPRINLSRRSGYLDEEEDEVVVAKGSSKSIPEESGMDHNPFKGILVDAGLGSEKTASERLKSKSKAPAAAPSLMESLLGRWW